MYICINQRRKLLIYGVDILMRERGTIENLYSFWLLCELRYICKLEESTINEFCIYLVTIPLQFHLHVCGSK